VAANLPALPDLPGDHLPPRPKASRVHRSGNPPAQRRSLNGIQLRERRLRAVELRVHGWTYDEIAVALEVSHHTAREDIRTILSETERETVPVLREVESTRLDLVAYEALQIMRDARGTELALKAMDRLMRAASLKAALFGLNAPVEVQVQAVTETDLELRALVQAVEAANEKTRARVVDSAVVEDAPPV